MRLFTPDTTFYRNYVDKGKFLLTWRLSLLFAITFFILSVCFIFIKPDMCIFYFPVFFCASTGFIYLKITKKYLPVFWIFTVCASVINSISLLTVTEIVHYSEFLWILAIVIFAFIGLGRTVGMWFIALQSVVITLHMFYYLNPHIEVHYIHSLSELIGTTVEMVFALFSIAYLMHQYLMFQSYAERKLKKANNRLEKKNSLVNKKSEENLILAKEIHHRVKNNLQIVISLLRMHRDEVRSQETKKHFSEAINRIMTMSLIHEKLYQEKSLSFIHFDDYMRDLARAITTSGNDRRDSIKLNISTEIPTVGLKTIVPLGLLLNELLTNSLKHAFVQGEYGQINVKIQSCENQRMCLEYSDSGNWIERPQEETGFGLELIDLLANQLDGKYSRTGSRYKFELGNLDH